MSYPVGTKIGGPLTNGSIQATYGTHIDYLGVGGYRTVETLALRDGIPVKDTLEFDGASSGMRRPGMIVHVLENERTYRLDIPGYAAMSDQNKYAALSSNTNWLEVEFGVGGDQGDTVTSFTYDPTTYALTLTTDRSTTSVDLSSLDLGGPGTTVTSVTLAADYTLALNLSDGGQRTVSLVGLAQDTKLTNVELNAGNLLEFSLSDGTSLVVDLSTIQPDLTDYAHTTYVDDADQALQAQITTEKNRMDTLVNGTPQALDTLAEIAAQLAADEAGAAAILATQQQHTTQIASIPVLKYIGVVDGSNGAGVPFSIRHGDYALINNTLYYRKGPNANLVFPLVVASDTTNWMVALDGSVEDVGEKEDAVFCFQVGVSYNPGHFHLAKLTVAQLRDLLDTTDTYYTGYSTVTIVTDEAAGHRHSVVLTYDPMQHALQVVRVDNEDGEEQENHSAYPILADSDVAKRTGGNTFTGAQGINGQDGYAVYDANRVVLQGPSARLELYADSLHFGADGSPNSISYLNASFNDTTRQRTLQADTTHFKVPAPLEIDDAATKQYVDQAVASAAGGGRGGTSTQIKTSDAYPITSDGAQSLTLPEPVGGIINMLVTEAPVQGYNVVRPIYFTDFSVSGTILTISGTANLSAGDEVRFVYFIKA